MTLPTLTVELGRLTGWVLGESLLGTDTTLATYEYDDITDKVLSASIRRGRQHELDRIETGTAQVSLLNQDGAFNAANTSSVYYPNIRPMVPLRIRATIEEPFSPLDIAGNIGWYDFSDAATLWTNTGMTTPVSADADPIRGVTDKSGTAHHVTHATGATYKVAIQNGLSVSRYNGTSQTLGPTTVTEAQPTTIIAVAKADVVDDSTNRVIVGSGASVSTLGHNAAADTGLILYNGASCQLNGSGDTNFNILAGYSNGTSSKIYKNGGAALVAADSGTNAWNDWGLGSFDQTSQWWDGDICEVLIYSGTLSLTDLNLIGDYLGAKWGITWTTAT